MTTIAWDGTSLAGDRRSTADGLCRRVRPKISRTPDGRLIGLSGASGRCAAMREWLTLPASERGKQPAFQGREDQAVVALEVLPDGTLLFHSVDGAVAIEEPFDAVGSGADFALGAMACGKSAADAVRIAARFDAGTDDSIDVLTLRDA
jgi:hypothetical protein